MIARDEARVIERCLESVAPIVDFVCVSDTGSTDGTPEIVERWLARREIRGEVRRHAWRNFGFNRTLALREAQRLLRRSGLDPASAFLLFVDADMTLAVGEDFDPSALRADVYRVEQLNGGMRYPNVRLARASLPGRFLGATHEYFDFPAGTKIEDCGALRLTDHNDGGSRADKFARDIRLLEDELRRDPGNARAMFYLAQSYRAEGDFGRALLWYRRRIAAGGWEEERWYSQYMIGQMHLAAGDWLDGLRALHEAIRMDPARAEPLRVLSAFLRERGHSRIAASYARRGAAMARPRDRSLFIEEDAYGHGLMEELSVTAYSSDDRDAGFAACEALALSRDVPDDVRARAANNEAFYAGPLGGSFFRISPEIAEFERPCNPSIVREDGGYLIHCRAVSYRIDAYQRYRATSPDGVLRTRNFLLRTDRDLRFLEQMAVAGEPAPLRETAVQGFEDARIFRWKGELALTATTNEHHPAGPLKISLLLLGADGRIRRHVPLSGYGDDRPQKNWLPYAGEDGGLRAVYGYEPTTVLAVDPESGSCAVALQRSVGRGLGRWRGSAGPLALPARAGGGWLAVVHEVAWQGLRYYLHRLARFDEHWNLTAASRPFTLLHHGIEFVCGACLSHDGEDLLLTFGVEDREAWLCRKPLKEALALLRPLPGGAALTRSGRDPSRAATSGRPA